MDLLELKKKLKEGVYNARAKGARISRIGVGDTNTESIRVVNDDNPTVCLLVAQILGQKNTAMYDIQAAEYLGISCEEAVAIECGFMGSYRTKNETIDFYDIGKDIRLELIEEKILSKN